MSFTFRPAKRESVSLLIGLAGGTGSGKTYSAMKLATGLGNGQRFVVIDTEAGRAKHYADEFEFDHGELNAPFRPDAYAEAIIAADQAGYAVIVVDSASHEHAGDGGLLDWHEEEYQRLGGRDAVKMTAWIAPKMAHRKFVSRLLQIRAHVILCFRAEEKIEIVKEDGKTVVRPKRSLTGLDGWMPVSEKSLPYELTLSFLLTADAPGIPKPIKLQQQHRAFIPLDVPISEDTGKALGTWAIGDPSAGNGGEILPAAAPEDGGGSSAAAPDDQQAEGDAPKGEQPSSPPSPSAPDTNDEPALEDSLGRTVIPHYTTDGKPGPNVGKTLDAIAATTDGWRWLAWATKGGRSWNRENAKEAAFGEAVRAYVARRSQES